MTRLRQSDCSFSSNFRASSGGGSSRPAATADRDDGGTAYWHTTPAVLSHREAEILKRLCQNRNQIVNTQDVLLELWGDDSFFNSRSLHVFITKLRHKLSQDEQIRIVNVRGIGYKLIVN